MTGIDLSEDCVRTAGALAKRVGLAGRVAYRQSSALALPFESGAFDGAYMMHVGMNIERRSALGRSAPRPDVAEPVCHLRHDADGGRSALRFPVHWAATLETSFVASVAEYHQALDAAGFEVGHERNRRDFAREVFRQAQLAALQARQRSAFTFR